MMHYIRTCPIKAQVMKREEPAGHSATVLLIRTLRTPAPACAHPLPAPYMRKVGCHLKQIVVLSRNNSDTHNPPPLSHNSLANMSSGFPTAETTVVKKQSEEWLWMGAGGWWLWANICPVHTLCAPCARPVCAMCSTYELLSPKFGPIVRERFRTARAQRQLLRCISQEHP